MCISDPVIAHCISLRQGWNLLSTVCPPANPTIPTVWREVVAREHLFLVKDQSGLFYIPANDFSNMEPWDVRQGYQAKLTEADTLVILNVPVPSDTPIPLRQGWNIAAYFPEEEMDVRDAFAGIQDALMLVKDDGGRFYHAQRGFSNMPPLRRGKGYQVNVSEAVELVYPGGEMMMMRDDHSRTGILACQDRQECLSYYRPVERTGGNMSLLISDLGFWIAEDQIRNRKSNIRNCELGVFTEKGLCVGAASVGQVFLPVTSERQTGMSVLRGLAVWADDPTTPEVDGAVEGEVLGFRLWDGRMETPALLSWEEGDDRFVTDGIAAATISGEVASPVYPLSFILYPSFPNPFNSTTLIRFDLPEAGKVSLVVTDLTGREVARILEGNRDAGSHSVVWEAVNQPSGIYLVRLEAPQGVKTSKVTLIR